MEVYGITVLNANKAQQQNLYYTRLDLVSSAEYIITTFNMEKTIIMKVPCIAAASVGSCELKTINLIANMKFFNNKNACQWYLGDFSNMVKCFTPFNVPPFLSTNSIWFDDIVRIANIYCNHLNGTYYIYDYNPKLIMLYRLADK